MEQEEERARADRKMSIASFGSVKSDNSDAEREADSNINSPLFNPFYHYAFDVYGSNTVRDLQGIPFEKMGEALDEIHNNIGKSLLSIL